MSVVVAIIKREDHLADFARIAREEADDVLQVVTQLVLAGAEQNSPIDRGGFRGSLRKDVSAIEPAKVIGTVYSINTGYSQVIEAVTSDGTELYYGRRPGAAFPNLSELMGWVRRKKASEIAAELAAIAGRAAGRLRAGRSASVESVTRSIAIRVGRAIVRRGLPNAGWRERYFKPILKSIEQNWVEIEHLLTEQMPDKIVERL